jgi:hypothetical protein
VTHFFIDYWLPLLGPALGWLVVALQQACWQHGQRQPAGHISQARLGYLSGLSRERVNRYLNDPGSWLAWFVAGVAHQGRSGRATNCYSVPADDPLTPAMAAGLPLYLAAWPRPGRGWLPAGRGGRAGLGVENGALPDRWAGVAEAMRALLRQERPWLLAELARLGSQVAGGAPGPPGHRGGQVARPCRAGGLLALVARGLSLPDPAPPGAQTGALSELAGQLAHHLLRPDLVYLDGQVFRQEWVPALGATLGWLVTVLRRHTFHNLRTGETRLAFGLGKGELAARLGVTERVLLRQLQPHLANARSLHPGSPLAGFLTELQASHHSLSGRVRPDWPSNGPDVTPGARPCDRPATPCAPPTGRAATPAAAATLQPVTAPPAPNAPGVTLSKPCHDIPLKTADSDSLERPPGPAPTGSGPAGTGTAGNEWPADAPLPDWLAARCRPPEPHQKLWRETLALVRLQMTRAAFETWLSRSRALEQTGDTLTVGVPDRYALEMLEQRLAPIVLRSLHDVPGGEQLRLEYRVVSGE